MIRNPRPTRRAGSSLSPVALATVSIMATRAPKGAARPRGGTASRTRQASSTARRSGTATRNARSSGKAYRSGTKRPAGRKPPSRRPSRPKSTNPIVILVGWLGGLLTGIWMALAHTVGVGSRESPARVPGTSTRRTAATASA